MGRRMGRFHEEDGATSQGEYIQTNETGRVPIKRRGDYPSEQGGAPI